MAQPRGRPVDHPLHVPLSRINTTSTARIASLSFLFPSPFVANSTHQLRYRVCLLLELVRYGFSFIGFLLDFVNWRNVVRDVTSAQHQELAPIMRSDQELEGGLWQIAVLYSGTEVSRHVEVRPCGSFSSSSSSSSPEILVSEILTAQPASEQPQSLLLIGYF